MTKKEEAKYKPVEDLEEILKKLKGERFKLSCGHHMTFAHSFSNSISIHPTGNNKYSIICTQCGY